VYKDAIEIFNHKYRAFIHFTTFRENEIPIKKELVLNTKKHEEFWLRSLFRRRDPSTLFTCYEANASQNSEKWEIRKYRSTYEKPEMMGINLHGGDVVLLKHSESGGYITIDELSEDKEGMLECYVRVCKSPIIG